MSDNLLNALQGWPSQPWVEALGWSLIHFVWQGAAVAAILAAALFTLRARSPHVRYLAACAALLAMAASPAATLAWTWRTASAPEFSVVAARPVADEFRARPATQPFDAAQVEAPTTIVAKPKTIVEAAPPSSALFLENAYRFRPLLPWMVALWLAGVFALSARLCVGWLGVQRMRRRGVRQVPHEWDDRLAQIAARLRVSRPVRLLESALVEAPTVIGWLRPIVLVPASAWVGLSPAQLEALLAHELAHVRRHDYAVNFVQTAVETLLFYHPAVWWVSRTIRQEREACCDEIAAEICGDRREYAHALASMEALRGRDAQFAMAANGGDLVRRIRRIVGVPAPQTNRSGWWLMAAIAACVLATIAINGPRGVQAVGPDDADKKKTADEEGWGKESGGLRIRVTPIAADVGDESPDLTKKTESFSRGDDVTLAVELKNVSDKPVIFMSGNTPFIAPHLFDLQFMDKDGKPVSRAESKVLTNILILIESSTQTLAPGKSLVVVLRPANFIPPTDYHAPPGEYQVRVRYHVDQRHVEQIAGHWPNKEHAKAWAGEAISNTAAFTVAEDPKAAKVAELRWGEPKDGLRAAVEFRHDGKSLRSDGSQSVPLNTALDVVFHIQNVSEKTISLCEESWKQMDPVTVKDESGKEQTLSGPWYSGLPIMARWTLKPKDIAEIRAYPLGIAADEEGTRKFKGAVGPRLFATPGKYQLRYKILLGSIRSGASQEGDWQGELTTGETTLTVRAITAEEHAAERARYFTGRVEFVAKDGKAIESGAFTVQMRDGSKSLEIHAGPIDVPGVTPDGATISVIAPGYEETRFQGVEFEREKTKRFELTAAEPSRFRLVSEGKPVAGAKVRHFNKTSDNASGGPYPMNGLEGPIHAVSAEDGTVVLSSLQKLNHGYEDLGAAVYFFYIEAEGFAGRFLGPVRAGADLGDVEMSRPLEVRGEIHGTAEELQNFAAEWDQPFELKTANPAAAWSYAVSQRLETNREEDKLTFHLTGLRPGKLRIISNFSSGTHHVSHTYTRRDPGPSDVVVELELTKSLGDLIITPAGLKPADALGK
jgi:beta-lactamase regulating signal transducer with metallopeptidase domain